jgi:DNA ligase-associated metallophosphoesterase
MRPHGLSKSHVITLSGMDMIPDLSGAVMVPESRTLLIADLHLEQGTSLARRGAHVPPFDTESSLALLARVIEQNLPQRIIFLGDSFHDGEASTRLAESHRSKLKAMTDRIETFWISGNHDPNPPRDVGGFYADEIMLGSIILRHEPSPVEKGQCEIAGHLHPGCVLVQRGRPLRGKCFAYDGKRLIMPAFGAYTGALSVTSGAYYNLFEEAVAEVLMIGKAALHRFPFSRLS